MILVFPDGLINGNSFSDSEWANTSSGQIESYVIDVVHDVDGRFAAIPSRQDRVIAGDSAGAYGAINVALHNLATFGSAQVWSGYYTQSRSGVFANATPAQVRDNSPIDYVEGLKPKLALYPFRIFLYAGRGDTAVNQLAPMVAALERGGAIATSAVYPGGHDWALWNVHFDQMLVLASKDVSASPAKGGKARGSRASGPTTFVTAPPARRPVRQVASPRPRTAGSHRGVHGRGPAQAIGGLILALVSAAAINMGFLLQHRALSKIPPVRRRILAWLRQALRSRSWLAGQAIGWAGFAAQIVAVALAPLSLVQAFAAGGLALSVPISACLFGHRLHSRQLFAVLAIALGLFILPIGLSAGTDHLHADHLGLAMTVALVVAVPIAIAGRSITWAIAAGLAYGIADAAIKALFVTWGGGGSRAVCCVWLVLALLATVGGFLAFQAALRGDRPVSAISLMNALSALVAVGCGLIAFGESMGKAPIVVALHLLAVALLLACVPVLASAQSEMAKPRSLALLVP
jgi:esterase/lipase superfamily enzyme